MKISYDPNYDVMYLKFCEGKIVDTVEVEANILIDYGPQGGIMGIEIIDASTLTKANPLHEIVILEKTTEKEETVFKSAKVQRIWGSALKYLPELPEELKGVKSDEKSKNCLDL